VNDLALRAVLVVVVVVVAGVVTLRRRNHSEAPTQPRGTLPSQLDRSDFVDAAGEWLVVAFTSSTCSTCADVMNKVSVLKSAQVAVQEVEFSRDRQLHDRYHIDAVPIVVIANADGVVHFGHIGPISATDLWAAMARCRDPQLPVSECGGTSS
jgi:hypothetical protein